MVSNPPLKLVAIIASQLLLDSIVEHRILIVRLKHVHQSINRLSYTIRSPPRPAQKLIGRNTKQQLLLGVRRIWHKIRHIAGVILNRKFPFFTPKNQLNNIGKQLHRNSFYRFTVLKVRNLLYRIGLILFM
ncbi:hypothetical protein WL17_13580 [Burkholderia ubonensis]|nr:hypothetical protein WL17_13580 [Burkholderia ubonensis]